jgi:hypothetical protein
MNIEGLKGRKIMNTRFLMIAVLAGLMAGTSWGIPSGVNITISDQSYRNPGDIGYNDWYSNREDEETEPMTLRSQAWDMEGMFFDSASMDLTIVGGYDFVNGRAGYLTGDIFIDLNGDAPLGSALDGTGANGTAPSSLFGYDYVVDLNFDTIGGNHKYSVYQLVDGTVVDLVREVINDSSNPWRYTATRTQNLNNAPLAGYDNLTLPYVTGLSDAAAGGFLGGDGTHNALTVKLDFISAPALVHYTMGCGNDNILGAIPASAPRVADVGTTALLLGVALVGLQGARKLIK